MRIALSLILLVAAGAAEAADAPFLFDVLHGRTTYHASWDRLMKLVQPTPDWLTRFNRDFDGMSGQLSSLTIDGKPYELAFVCKPSECDVHKFVVLFDDNGAHAFGALGGKENSPAFFGKPSQAEQDAMTKAVQE